MRARSISGSRSRLGRRRGWILVGLVLAVTLVWALSVSYAGVAIDEEAGGTAAGVPVYLFWGDGCPHCANEEAFLEALVARHSQVEIRDYEVWYDEANREIFQQFATKAGVEISGVPTTFVDDRVWVGFHEGIGRQIEDAVLKCLDEPCLDPGRGIVEAASLPTPLGTDAAATDGGGPPTTTQTLWLPLFGDVDLGEQSLAVSTVLIALVDGFNPCSLWVLSLLLGLVLASGSRRKVLFVGGVFLTVTATVYGLFIAGLFSAFAVVQYSGWIRAVVATLALIVGLVNVKDYFFYKRGFSLTISDRFKPKIYQDLRRIKASEASLGALIGATVVMALGISLVELPCTAGFPVIWTGLLANQGVGTAEFLTLLVVYMAVYLLDELAIFASATITLKASRFEERQGRTLKLVGGTVMLALALVLIVDPDLMGDLAATLSIFSAAIVTSTVVLFVNRIVTNRRERRTTKTA